MKRHLDRTRAVSSRDAVERSAVVSDFCFCPCLLLLPASVLAPNSSRCPDHRPHGLQKAGKRFNIPIPYHPVEPMPTLQQQLGEIDIYFFDQLFRSNIMPGRRVLDAGCGPAAISSISSAKVTRSSPPIRVPSDRANPRSGHRSRRPPSRGKLPRRTHRVHLLSRQHL
jgi:hypothetical protein